MSSSSQATPRWGLPIFLGWHGVGRRIRLSLEGFCLSTRIERRHSVLSDAKLKKAIGCQSWRTLLAFLKKKSLECEYGELTADFLKDT